MRTSITHWGNSLAVRIPKAFAIEAGIQDGTEVEISVTSGEIIVAKAKPSLKDLLVQISANNIHSETDWGKPVGNEAW